MRVATSNQRRPEQGDKNQQILQMNIKFMNNENLRNKAAELVYQSDLELDASVKQVVDMMVKFGEFCARYGYRTAKIHELMKNDPLFRNHSEDEFITQTFSK